MEEDGEDFSPFWDQSSANRRRGQRLSPSSFLNSGVLIFFLCIAAILFLFFVIPSVLSLTSQIFRPNLVKKSWDSINVVLVLFALLFGFLSRNLNYDSTYSDQDHQFLNRNEVQKSNPTTPMQWYEYSDRTAFSSAPAAVGGLRRTHSSHPDLRGVSSWDAGDERWRFFDDTQVDAQRSLGPDVFPRRRSWKRVIEEEDGEGEGSYYGKTIQVDKMVTRAEEVPLPTPTPPPPVPEAEPAPPSPPPAPLINQKPRRSFESIPRSEKTNVVKSDEPEPLEPQTLPAAASVAVPHSVRRKHKRGHEREGRRERGNGQVLDEAEPEMSAPLPPPPPPSVPHSVRRRPKRAYETEPITEKRTEEVEKEPEPQLEALSPPQPAPQSPPTPPTAPLSPPTNSKKKPSKSERKRGAGTATKDFLLHFQRKTKKKQRQKSVENLEALFEPETSSHTLIPPPSPPPPPPPPPPSVFNNFFSSKKAKSKKFLSVPPPPPPPPRHRITTARASTSTTTQSSQISSGKPPLPVKISSFSSVDENSNSGGESPMMGYGSHFNRIPPPPPPPPFRMPSWKFMVQGDYVRVGSVNSSRSVSPDLEDGESPRSDTSAEISAAVDGGEVAASPLFCPSPDVDTKAAMFIAKFRAGLKIQKMNSMKQKQGLGLSNLGPDTKPRPGPKHI